MLGDDYKLDPRLFEQLLDGLMPMGGKSDHEKQFDKIEMIDDAISRGQIDEARKMLDDMNSNDLLIHAVDFGNIRVVKLLLERKETKVNYRCIMRDAPTSPLALACYFGHLDIVILLLKRKGIRVNGFYLDDKLSVPLHHAMGVIDDINSYRKNVNIEIVKLMLNDPRVDVNELSVMGYSALQMLAQQPQPTSTQMIKLLLEHNDTQVNLAVPKTEWTALTLAISRGCTDNFRLLMDHKDINVNFVGVKESWLAPLFVAVVFERFEMIKVLVQHEDIDANVKAPAEAFQCCRGAGDISLDSTPLFEAAKRGYSEIVHLLLTCNTINVNLSESLEKNTPLHAASFKGHADIVKQLLRHDRIDVGLIEKGLGKTAFGLACLAGNIEVVKVFLKSGHQLDVKRVLKDFTNTSRMLLFIQQSDLDAEKVIPKYDHIRRLLEKHRQPSKKAGSSKSKKPKQPDSPSDSVEQRPPQPVASKEQKESTEEKVQARKGQEVLEFRELEMSLDMLD